MSGILTLIIILIAIGFGLYLVNNYITIAEPFKKIINFVVIIAVLIWLAQKYLPAIL